MHLKHILALAFVTLCFIQSNSQKSSDSKSMTFDTKQYKEIHLYNTGGQVNVKATSGTTASFDVKRVITANSNSRLNKAKQNYFVDTLVVNEILYVFIHNPYQVLEIDEYDGSAHFTSRNNGKWQWSGNGKNHPKTDFSFDIKMPANQNIRISTHREDLHINGMRGQLTARAHYGDIELVNIEKLESVRGHHGDIDVSFASIPTNDIVYSTHHGDIKVAFPSEPSADISMDSHHGSFYTDFDWEPKPQVSTSKKNKRGTTYRYGKDTSVRMGSGAVKMKMHTHHGDMYIVKK